MADTDLLSSLNKHPQRIQLKLVYRVPVLLTPVMDLTVLNCALSH